MGLRFAGGGKQVPRLRRKIRWRIFLLRSEWQRGSGTTEVAPFRNNVVGPDAGETGDAFGGDGEVGAGADENFFEAADESDDAEGFEGRVCDSPGRTNASAPTRKRLARADASTSLRAGFCVRSYTKAAEIEDGVADDLAGAVESDVAAAVAFEELNAALGEEFARGDNVNSFRIAAEADDGRVFEQEQDVADSFFLAQGDELLLQAKAGRVVNGAELNDGDQRFAFFLETRCFALLRCLSRSFILAP
jgi:hypothetical protein